MERRKKEVNGKKQERKRSENLPRCPSPPLDNDVRCIKSGNGKEEKEKKKQKQRSVRLKLGESHILYPYPCRVVSDTSISTISKSLSIRLYGHEMNTT